MCSDGLCQEVRLPKLNDYFKVPSCEEWGGWIIQFTLKPRKRMRRKLTDLKRLEPILVVPFANSFLLHVAKNNPALPLPLIKSNHFYKQMPKANQNILEVLKCWFTSCSSHKGNKGLEIKTVFTVLSKMGKEIMATQMCLDKLHLQVWVYAWLPCYCMGVNFYQHQGQSCCWTPPG